MNEPIVPFKLTMRIEGRAEKTERGYEQRPTLAELSVDIDAAVAWDLYAHAIATLTSPELQA